MTTTLEKLKPQLSEPFPRTERIWTDPITGFKVPKLQIENLEWRSKLLRLAANDTGLQNELMAASKASILFWVNAFMWTYHQFDVIDGKRVLARHAHVPFITWDVQDDVLSEFVKALGIVSSVKKRGGTLTEAVDILVNKSRDMGASWMCIGFMHWLWLFWDDSQLLELSRTEDYVDKPGNMKALFQRHDYINEWLPEWMLPPDCLHGEKNRTNMHMKNVLNGSCIDGEATTQHAASGDRRLVILLDEFAKVERGKLMRSATRDAGLMRIVNSTVAGPGTEYSRWKNDGTIKVVPLMWWEHPDKGKGRYVEQNPVTKAWKIRSPWYDNECLVRSPMEVARELDAEDLDSGSSFFTRENIDKHIAFFGCKPMSRWDIKFKRGVADDQVKDIVRRKDLKRIEAKRTVNGKLRVWVELINGRLDQTKDYRIGIDLSKGQGASNSVFSIRCVQTSEKVAEWRDANTPPYEMAYIGMALSIWVGGRRKLPFQKWEMNGPGWDYGRQVVKVYLYPYYYKDIKAGNTRDRKTKRYGWHANTGSKLELLTGYDRALAHGGIINHSLWGLEEAKAYINYDGGGIGPACLVEETAGAKKTHGDVVIADALSLDDTQLRKGKSGGPNMPQTTRCAAYRKKLALRKKKKRIGFGDSFDFRRN